MEEETMLRFVALLLSIDHVNVAVEKAVGVSVIEGS